MMFWIVSLPRDDAQHCIQLGTFGRNGRHIISNVKAGDKVAFVVTKEKPWKLIALGTVTTSYYVDDSKIFKKDGMFPDRFDFTIDHPNNTTNSFTVDFEKLVCQLTAVTHPEYWPVYFKNGMTRMSLSDWQMLEAAFRPTPAV